MALRFSLALWVVSRFITIYQKLIIKLLHAFKIIYGLFLNSYYF